MGGGRMSHADKILAQLKQGAEAVDDDALAERLRERAAELEEGEAE